MNVSTQIEIEEGRRHTAYPDGLTGGAPWTIGVGHTGPEVHEGLIWTDDQIDRAKSDDIENALQECHEHFPWFFDLNEPRQAVLIGMCFNLGMPRLLEFHKTLAAIRDQHFDHAANEMLDSNWARELPGRVHRASRQMATGEWQ